MDVLSGADVLASTRASLGLPAAGAIDDVYIAASLRRMAGFICPCSPKTLIRSVVESHHGMERTNDEFIDHVERIVESLLAIGDLLELGHVTTLDETVKGTWVFAAPPSFVVHPSGTAILLGLSADEATPLPADLRIRIKYRGVARSIEPAPLEDLKSVLLGLGLRELSIETWLRHPKLESAAAITAALDAQLSLQGPSGQLEDLRVLDHNRGFKRYRDRWTGPASLSGRFIVRRPQAYGADLWGYAELHDGKSAKLIDFPLPAVRWRGCDIAWRLLMAIDALSGTPQAYKREALYESARLEFFSPIPDWARRRLSTIGTQVEPIGGLLSFIIAEKNLNAEEQFLCDYLFLARAEN